MQIFSEKVLLYQNVSVFLKYIKNVRIDKYKRLERSISVLVE
jgi:hypothetical protein